MVQDILLKLSLRSILIVHTFIKKLKQQIGFRYIKQNIIKLIDDQSYFFIHNTPKQKLLKFPFAIKKYIYFFKSIKQLQEISLNVLQYFQSILNSIKLFDPSSNYVVIFNIILFLFTVVSLFYIPLEIINGNIYDIKYGSAWKIFKLINCIAFILDISIKFNTGQFEKGAIILDRKQIAKNYIYNGFFYDTFSVIPAFQSLLDFEQSRIFNILILLKIQSAKKIINQLQDYVSFRNSKIQNLLSLISLMLMICSICHIFACLFLGLAVIEEQYQLTNTNWMKEQMINGTNTHWFVKYTYALYFAVTTMVTVGYGDIHPVNFIEVLFTIFGMFVSCGVFAYSINLIGDLFREFNRMQNEFKNQMTIVNRLLVQKNINPDLNLQVRKFFEYKFYAEPQLSMEQEEQIMQKLSNHLREKVIIETNIQIINYCKIMKQSFSEKISKNEIIFEPDTYFEDPLIYIISQGSIQAYIECDKNISEIAILQELNQGECFGMQNFFALNQISYGFKAKEFTILYAIQKSKFLQIIQNNQNDYEKYCLLKDKVQFCQNLNCIGISCYGCHQEGHTVQFCNYSHYIPNKEKVILKDLYSKSQYRIKSVRKQTRRISTLLITKKLKEIQVEFLKENQFDIDKFGYTYLNEKLDDNSIYFHNQQINNKQKNEQQEFINSIDNKNQNQNQKQTNKSILSFRKILMENSGQITGSDKKIRKLNSIQNDEYNPNKFSFNNINSTACQINKKNQIKTALKKNIFLLNNYFQNTELYSQDSEKHQIKIQAIYKRKKEFQALFNLKGNIL
ncbi:hypothetical protein IMG5_160540 [Ichthyophthirius multifiliis]|uniref:Cyclic nucleotide-binding domain-containing protein n=1 Tax=Ichthyophthirius multifiliis TaxID=5932 RepID=G0QZY4_ICHMU|nr:hypothetical protein IMG5_160540 [Ichthyophthirius multifiliis]EGR29217.1 hypothetical protein IMG5_160540 [Ichthyophthirius multifiliis]|eukprot:XP_004030453.1 hypothetical protein IMG5_160540 [Ichthyophthirius multifiliis]